MNFKDLTWLELPNYGRVMVAEQAEGMVGPLPLIVHVPYSAEMASSITVERIAADVQDVTGLLPSLTPLTRWDGPSGWWFRVEAAGAVLRCDRSVYSQLGASRALSGQELDLVCKATGMQHYSFGGTLNSQWERWPRGTLFVYAREGDAVFLGLARRISEGSVIPCLAAAVGKVQQRTAAEGDLLRLALQMPSVGGDALAAAAAELRAEEVCESLCPLGDMVDRSPGLFGIISEREHQFKKGWTRTHDAEHNSPDTLARAAVAYLSHPSSPKPPAGWPFSEEAWRPAAQDAPGRSFEKAGALVAAALDLLGDAPDLDEEAKT